LLIPNWPNHDKSFLNTLNLYSTRPFFGNRKKRAEGFISVQKTFSKAALCGVKAETGCAVNGAEVVG
jgi:hypothetical protein